MLSETIYATTQDGWRLALHHLAPTKVRRRFPVLMVHGLGANRLNLDLDDRYSIARGACARGFDVYVLELRGAGLSIAPGGKDRHLFQWGFADYAERDLPAAVAHVLRLSGARAVHGLGHSMGGMLFYALGAARNPHLRSITAVGSPLIAELQLHASERRLLHMATHIAPSTSQRRVPLRRLMGAAGRFIHFSRRVVDGVLLNTSNTENHVMARMAREAIADVPLQLVFELTRQMTYGNKAKGAPAAYRYESELDKIQVPVFALSGTVDRIGRPRSVRAGVSRIMSQDVRYRELGRRHGDSADYGHVDLLVGRNAPTEVFPLLLDFLEEVD